MAKRTHGKQRSVVDEYVEMETLDKRVETAKAVEEAKADRAKARADAEKANAAMQRGMARKQRSKTVKKDLEAIKELLEEYNSLPADPKNITAKFQRDYIKSELNDMYGIAI